MAIMNRILRQFAPLVFLACALSTIYAQTEFTVNNPSREGGRMRICNTAKTGATTSDWSIYNMTYPYGNGLKFWRYYADGSNPGPVLTLWDNGSASFAGSLGVSVEQPRSRLDIGTNLGCGRGARFGDYIEINERECINNSGTIGWNACIAADDGTFSPVHPPGAGMVLTMHSGGVADLDFWGRDWGGSSSPVSLGSFTHVMRLSTNGNVGIGTTNPSERLSVNGRIRAKEVVVETANWSDYVFAEDYELMPLAQVSAHIKEKKHLPGVPSNADVAEKGVSLAQMQSILLAKIEELTLHAIAQEQRIEAQEAVIRRLQVKCGEK
jgi:hypothetical protein